MAKPDFLKWCNDDSAAKITNPGTTKKLAGFLYKEKPAFQYVNWLFNALWKWLLGLQGVYCEIVVGTSTQVTNKEATHTINDLDDTLCVAGSKILILDGTHTLTGALSLSNADLKIYGESSLSILDVATYTATFSGARALIGPLKVTNGGASDVIVSGAGSNFYAVDTADSVFALSNGAALWATGSTSTIDVKKVLQNGQAILDKTTAETYSGQKNFAIATLTDGANIAWNLNTQQSAKVTLAGNRTLDNPTNMVDGGIYQVRVKQDATGSRTLAFGTAYKWPNDIAPTLATGADDVDILTFTSDGTYMFGTHTGPYAI